MYKMKVKIDESRLNFPLRTMNAGLLSSFYLELVDVPSTAASVNVYVEYLDGDGATQNFVCACSEATTGDWTCYCVPLTFPAVSESGLKYHVVATDENDNAMWLGSGDLRVLDNPANGGGVEPSVVPGDCYIRNPTTGLYHLLTAVTDEDGNLTIQLADEGIEK